MQKEIRGQRHHGKQRLGLRYQQQPASQLNQCQLTVSKKQIQFRARSQNHYGIVRETRSGFRFISLSYQWKTFQRKKSTERVETDMGTLAPTMSTMKVSLLPVLPPVNAGTRYFPNLRVQVLPKKTAVDLIRRISFFQTDRSELNGAMLNICKFKCVFGANLQRSGRERTTLSLSQPGFQSLSQFSLCPVTKKA